MTVLKILGFFFAFCAIVGLIEMINSKFEKNFNFAIFSKPMAITQLINGLFFFVGKSWYDSAVVHNGDKLNGEILMALGVIIAISTIVMIYKRTNLMYGTLGSVIHIASLLFFSFIGSFLFILYVIGNIILIFTSKPVYVVNK